MKTKRVNSGERRSRSVLAKIFFAALVVASIPYLLYAAIVFYAQKTAREIGTPLESLELNEPPASVEPIILDEPFKPYASFEFPNRSNRKALLIAADDYGAKASALPGAKRDVEALRARLLEIGFEERNVVTLQTARTNTGEIDYDFLPQKAKIEERFKAFVDDLKPGDFAFVFLSGHGLEAPRTNEAFFVPIDFDPEEPLATAVSVDAMMTALAKSAATFRWFAVDACRSKPSVPSRTLFASRSTDASPLSEIANVPESVVLLQSCRSGQNSYEGGYGDAKEIANGFFALSLLEALDSKESKADANKDGVASFMEICQYVTTRTRYLARTYYNKEQTPTLSVADLPDFPFLTELMVDGIPYDDWKRMNDAFEAAKASRLKGEYEAALDKLALALQIAPENEACRAEETELRQLVAATKRPDVDEEETTPTLTPEEAKARYLEGRRMAWGLDGTNVYGLRAFEALKEAAENGCAEAAGELACLYVWGGEGTNVDYERARRWAEKGAEAGDPTAQYVLAGIYYLGRGVELDDEKAEAFGRAAFEGFRRLAESGDVVAIYRLSAHYYSGLGVEKDEAKATRYLEEAAKANLPAATYTLGFWRLRGVGVEKNGEEGARLLRAAADRGDAMAAARLGWILKRGFGGERDEKAALEWYRRSAERGCADAMNALGYFYLYGRGGVEKDETRAFEWFLKAANSGAAQACAHVGWAYEWGLVGFKRDETKALEWYRMATKLGFPNAAFALADFYDRGVAVERDEARAQELRRLGFDLASRMAKMGDEWAASLVGECYENGVGVEADASQAFEWYRKASDLGNTAATVQVGRCYEAGFGVPQDASKALELYRQAAELGDAQATRVVGECYENGVGVAVDESQAFEWRRKAAELGDAGAMVAVGKCYERGVVVEADASKALELYRQAAELGDASATTALGDFYRWNAYEQDASQAVEWYRKGAELGDASATVALASCYEFGVGVEQDDAQAFEWYRKAAEHGNVTPLANYFERGDGREPDDAKTMTTLGDYYSQYSARENAASLAFKWYRKAAELGDAKATVVVGRRYAFGVGVEADAAKAFEWYRKAAELGDAEATREVGDCYKFGVGVKQDVSQAFEWYRKAAELGDAWATGLVGECYENGVGVEADAAKAFEWYCKAADLGDAEATIAVGGCYERGVGVEADATKAFEWYRKAAEKVERPVGEEGCAQPNDAEAAAIIGRFYARSSRANAATLAFKWFCKGAELGDAEATLAVGGCYERGDGVERDPEQAFAWRREAATERGSALAIVELARCYEEGIGVPQDAEKGKELRRRLDEAMKAAGGEESELKIELDDFKNDGVPLKTD